MTERDVCADCGNDAWIVAGSDPPRCESCFAEAASRKRQTEAYFDRRDRERDQIGKSRLGGR